MKTLITLFSAVSLLAIFQFQLLVWAAPSGQYSINFHFVPPLFNDNCTLGQIWEPANLRCARCFCMTGRVSRCFPKGGGCNPTQTDNSTSSTTTPRTDESTTVTVAPVPGPQPPNGQSSPAPTSSTAAPAPTTASTSTAAPARA